MHAFLSWVGIFLSGCVVGAIVWNIYKARIVAQLQVKVEELESKLGIHDARSGPAPRP